MRATILALLLLPTACSGALDAAPSDQERRDTAMAELVDRTAELEKRVDQLEAEKKLNARLSPPVAAAPVATAPDFERDRLETRVKDLERDAGGTPPP